AVLKARDLAKALKEQEEAAKKAQQQHQALAGVFGRVTGTLGGFVRAGLQGTAEYEQFGVQMQRISREIATLFTPIIHRAVAAVTQISGWFQRLSRDQQDQAAKWIMVGVAVLGAAVVLPRLQA